MKAWELKVPARARGDTLKPSSMSDTLSDCAPHQYTWEPGNMSNLVTCHQGAQREGRLLPISSQICNGPAWCLTWLSKC